MITVKIYLGLSLVLLWTVWGQFIFRKFLDLAYTSQDLQAPSYVVSANCRVLIYCTVTSKEVPSVYFSSFCLLVSSVSNFCPDTRGRWWSLFQAYLFSRAVGRENTTNKYHWCVWGVLTVSRPHWVCPCSQCVCFPSLHCSGSRLLCQELSEAGPGLHALPRSKPLRFRFLDTPQRRRLVWDCILCPSQV